MNQLQEMKDLAKTHKAFWLASYLVGPDGRVSEYIRLIDADAMRMIEKRAGGYESMLGFYKDDEWYAHLTKHFRTKNASEEEAS